MSERKSKERERLFFDEHQWSTVEAAMARIIPTDHEPGAKEAGTAAFVDRYLSGTDYVYARPDGSGFEELTGKRAQAWRRRIDTLRQTYVEGVKEMDRRSQAQFDAPFVQLTAEQQDLVLTGMEASAPEDEEAMEEEQATAAWEPPAMQQTLTEVELDFFPLLALHTRQGFYADPIYGGNKDCVGWRVIGFPGPASLAEVHSGRYSTLDYFAEEDGFGA